MPGDYATCPTRIISAPAEIVWRLLTRPEAWGEFYDVRVLSVEPPGPATAGQTILAESGPRLLRLKLLFRLAKVDRASYELAFDALFPFGLTVREDLNCVPLGPVQCRVNYRCNFSFPKGWRGAIMRLLIRREFDSGPIDSLSRLQMAAERLHAVGARP
jgi:hypothetical protein